MQKLGNQGVMAGRIPYSKLLAESSQSRQSRISRHSLAKLELSAGAQGYLLKDTSNEELVRAILEVAQGDAPLSPQVARYLLRMFHAADDRPASRFAGRPESKPDRRPHENSGSERLTAREAEILTLVSGGQSGVQVATRLGLSVHTVNTHLRNCHAKLAARNRLQAINRARESGQIE